MTPLESLKYRIRESIDWAKEKNEWSYLKANERLLIALEALEETKKLLVSEYGPRIYEVNFECIDHALDKIVGSK